MTIRGFEPERDRAGWNDCKVIQFGRDKPNKKGHHVPSEYGRSVAILFFPSGPCDRCERDVPCIGIDTSDEEYGPGLLCWACCNDIFSKAPR